MRAQLLLLFLAAASSQSLHAPLTLLDASSAPNARCLDGSQSGYYFLAGAGANASKFTISLEGGGECVTAASCNAQLTTALGSSKYFPPSLDFSNSGSQFNEAAQGSTDFASWSHVQVPYCSQDVHTGTRTAKDPAAFNLYFAGHLVFEAVLDALDARTPSLRDATDIILTGDSAGGIGVWPNLDYLAARYPKARVVGAPIAGFYFFAYPYTGINHTSSELADFRPAAWPQHYALWESFVDADCAAAHAADPSFCLLANNSFPYVTSETFAIQAQTDQVVLLAHDWLPQAYLALPPERAYMEEWHRNMTDVALAPMLDPTNARTGAFNAACFIHTSFSLSAPLIGGKSFMAAFSDFYFRRTPPAGYKLADDCGIICNPTCPSS